MAIKISAHKKESETQPPEPVIAPVAEEPEQPAGWVPPADDLQTVPMWDGKKLYDGKNAPGWLWVWRLLFFMIFGPAMDQLSAIGSLSAAPFLYLYLVLLVVVSTLSFCFSFARKKVFRVLWLCYIGLSIGSVIIFSLPATELATITIPSCFAFYLYKSEKVKLYLNYNKTSSGTVPSSVKPKVSIPVVLCFVFALISIASLVGLSVQMDSVSSLEAHILELEEQYETVLDQKSAVINNATSLQKEVISLKNEIRELKSQHSDLQTSSSEMIYDLAWYVDNVALITNYYGNCAYHAIYCPRLTSNFYVLSTIDARSIGCWPCSDCH